MRTHRRVRLWVEQLEGRLVPSVTVTSTNWAGYAITSAPGSVSAVSGTWTVPRLTNDIHGFSATWVGIDGYSSRTVEQIGTEADFIGGQDHYSAWYEMFPRPAVVIDLPIRAGDQITASVTYTAGGFTLSLQDTTSGGSFTKTTEALAATAKRSSAEWIVEAPSAGGVLPLADFGKETISAARATVGGTSGAITGGASAKVVAIDMETRSGAAKATTSALDSTDTSFTVTRAPAGTAKANGPSATATTKDVIVVVPTITAVLPPTPLPPTLVPAAINAAPVVPPPVSAANPGPATLPVLGTLAPLAPFFGTVTADTPAANPPDRNDAPAVPGGAPAAPAAPANPPQPATAVGGRSDDAVGSWLAVPVLEGGEMPVTEPVEVVGRNVEVAGAALALVLGGAYGLRIEEDRARRQPRPR